jgi:pre-mRNA-splicing factor CWC22
MKAQAASLPFTPVFAALIAIINTKLPQVGELVLTRLVSQFRRAFKRNDKVRLVSRFALLVSRFLHDPAGVRVIQVMHQKLILSLLFICRSCFVFQTVCLSTASFIAHLVNQSVAHELVALQILLLLLENPTSDSIEIACALTREVGAFLTEHSAKPNNLIFERFRAVLHEGNIEKRVQYMIEVLFQTRKDRYKDNPIMQEGLDLVEEDEQITHRISLEDELKVEEGLSESLDPFWKLLCLGRVVYRAELTIPFFPFWRFLSPDVFKVDPEFLENEEKYKQIKAEILGDEESDDESGSGSSGSESDDESDEESAAGQSEHPSLVSLAELRDEDTKPFRRAVCFSFAVVPNKHGIKDMTETNMINLRRTIYLTIMNSVRFVLLYQKLRR